MSKIERILKHNRFMNSIYTLSMSLFFRFIGLFVRIDKNLILFNSFKGLSYNDSPRCLYEAMKKDERFKNCRFVWAFKNVNDFKHLGCEKVRQDSFLYFITALKAKCWITNVNIERGLYFKKRGTIYINTWHGSGPKKDGNSVKNRTSYSFKDVDILLADGNHCRSVFLRDWKAKKESIYMFGRPRDDELYFVDDNKKSEVFKELKLDPKKKYILFAPTWREIYSNENNPNIFYDLDNWANNLGSEYVILYRPHSLAVGSCTFLSKSIIDVSKIANINSLYIIADILVSDYSSCFTDFSILEKPMICFAPDYDEYMAERGLYYDLSLFFKDGVLKSEELLLDAIKKMDFEEYKKYSIQYKKYMICCGGHATEQTIEEIAKRLF